MARWIHARRFGATALLVAGVLCWGAESRAQGSGQTVAVVVEGPDAEAVTAWVEDRVVAPDTLKEGNAFRNALRAKGALPLRLAASSSPRDAQLVGRAQAAAKEAGVDHAILVDVQKTPKATRVHVWHIDNQHRSAVVDSDITLMPTASAMQESRAVLALGPVPSRAAVAQEPARESAPPAAEPQPAGPHEAAPSPPMTSSLDSSPGADWSPAAEPDHGDSSLLWVQAALGVGARHFSYVDRVTPALRPYDLNAAPMATISAAVYPLTFTGLPFVKDFGISGEYSQAVALASQDSAGNYVDTSWQTFDVGATERIALMRGLLANVSAGYGGNDFQFNQGLPGAPSALPSVAYRFVRVGADVRYRFLTAFSAYGGGSYMEVLSSGYTAELFPRQTVGGVEGHLGASYLLARRWEVSLTAAYTRMFYSFNPVPGDPTVAGGALDEQTRLMAGFAYVM